MGRPRFDGGSDSLRMAPSGHAQGRRNGSRRRRSTIIGINLDVGNIVPQKKRLRWCPCPQGSLALAARRRRCLPRPPWPVEDVHAIEALAMVIVKGTDSEFEK